MTKADLGDQYAYRYSLSRVNRGTALNTTSAFDRYTAHGGPIKGLVYSEKLGLLVSTSFDYTAVVWDSGSMKELKR